MTGEEPLLCFVEQPHEGDLDVEVSHDQLRGSVERLDGRKLRDVVRGDGTKAPPAFEGLDDPVPGGRPGIDTQHGEVVAIGHYRYLRGHIELLSVRVETKGFDPSLPFDGAMRRDVRVERWQP